MPQLHPHLRRPSGGRTQNSMDLAGQPPHHPLKGRHTEICDCALDHEPGTTVCGKCGLPVGASTDTTLNAQ